MSNHTSSILFGRYLNSFTKMTSSATIDITPSSQITIRSSHVNYYLSLACVIFAAYLLQCFQSSKRRRVDVPFYKASLLKWMFDAENLVMDSYTKFYGKVYQIKATEGVQVLIPPSLLGEIKNLPEDILSATEAVNEAMMSDYTQFSLGPHGSLMSALVRTKLTQNVAKLIPHLKEEIDHLVATEFPDCTDWTPVKIQPLALRAIVRLGGRAFVGPEINRNEEWMETSVNFAVHVFVAVVKLQFMPTWLRPLGKHLVSDLRKIKCDMERARRLLQPVIEQRLRDMDTPGYERPDDLIQWLLETLPEADRADAGAQAHLQLVLSAASVHTTNNLLVDCVYDLAADPAVQGELREEAEAVFAGGDGWSKKDSLPKLKKMDSFIKEVQRMRGNITAFIRKVIKPIDLSDGTHLPPGTKLLAPQAGMSQDERYFPSPGTFDALRFYKLRQRSCEDANRWQFTSIGDTNMNFGAGKHACPGRFFAGSEIKMMLAYFLLNYDMRLKDGEARPQGMVVMMSKTPDPNGEILFRRRGCANN